MEIILTLLGYAIGGYAGYMFYMAERDRNIVQWLNAVLMVIGGCILLIIR